MVMAAPAVRDDEEGIAGRLWTKFRDESVFALYTPFVVCVASGVLDPRTFLHCVSQDVYFLKAFAQAYELAEECADDEDDKTALRKLRKRVLKKFDDHENVVREWGFELPSERISNDATVKYTDFLLATASGKVEGEKFLDKIATPFEKTKLAAYMLAAIGPCLRLYAFISKEILALEDPEQSNHIYKKWIDSLSSQNYEETALQIEGLLDNLSISLTGEELKVLENLYHQAMKLGVKFFSAQPMVQQTIVPLYQLRDSTEVNLSLFCDFDMTCTTIDSSALLAEIAIRTSLKADLRTTWGVLSSQYAEEYEQCVESIMASEKVEEFNYEGLCGALEQLSDFEKKANSRVFQSGALRGLNLEDIKRAGEHLILQDGCKGFFREIVQCENLKTDIHILSHCWCGDLIQPAFSSRNLNVRNVHSNELAHEDHITTGEIIKKVESPAEKLHAFNDIMNSRSKNGEHFTVYVGGSLGDLLCLLKADIGIVIGSSSSLRRVGHHFGISFVPLFSGAAKKQAEFSKISGRLRYFLWRVEKDCSSNWKGSCGILYTVSGWAEIHAFVLGL